MTSYFLDVTNDLLIEVFNNPIFEVFTITFLLTAGLGIFSMLRKSV